MCAFHLVVGQANDGGIRNICWLLELCQLDRFIASSYGAQQKIAVSIEMSEPVSNFLILEEYAAKRDASTWNAAVDEALKPFSVTVIQCVSDQATALIAHAETYLGVHHSPDLFHVQQEASRATSAPLNRQTEKAEKAFKGAEASHQENAKKLKDFNENWPCSLQQLDLEKELCSRAPVLEETLTRSHPKLVLNLLRSHVLRKPSECCLR